MNNIDQLIEEKHNEIKILKKQKRSLNWTDYKGFKVEKTLLNMMERIILCFESKGILFNDKTTVWNGIHNPHSVVYLGFETKDDEIVAINFCYHSGGLFLEKNKLIDHKALGSHTQYDSYNFIKNMDEIIEYEIIEDGVDDLIKVIDENKERHLYI